MKRLYSILDDQKSLLLCAKGTPLYAGSTGGFLCSSLEQELYRETGKHYRVLYPMEYWCSGIVPLALEGEAPLWEGDIRYTYDLIVHNPLFFKKETEVCQPVFWKGRKFIVHPSGAEFQASFSTHQQYKDFSLLRACSRTPFHQGILLLSSFLGSPILGDFIYGMQTPLLLSTLKKRKYKAKSEQEELPLIQRPALHLSKVEKDGQVWEAPWPKDFQASVANLKKYNALAEEQFLETWLENLKS